MSSLTTCNFCNLKRIKENAKDKKVVMLPSLSSSLGGYDVFVYPKGLSLSKMLNKKDRYWAAWFMSISDKCCC